MHTLFRPNRHRDCEGDAGKGVLRWLVGDEEGHQRRLNHLGQTRMEITIPNIRSLTPEEIGRLIALIRDEKKTYNEVATEMGVPYYTVASVCRRIGLSHENYPARNNQYRGADLAERNKELIKRYAAGERTKVLVKEYGLSRERICQLLREAGVPRRGTLRVRSYPLTLTFVCRRKRGNGGCGKEFKVTVEKPAEYFRHSVRKTCDDCRKRMLEPPQAVSLDEKFSPRVCVRCRRVPDKGEKLSKSGIVWRIHTPSQQRYLCGFCTRKQYIKAVANKKV